MQILRQSGCRSATSTIFIYFRVFIGIGLTLLTLIFAFISGGRLAGSRRRSDPLAVVSEFFSGDARQTALARGFTCNNPDYLVTLSDFCTQSNSDQIYAGIYLQITDGNAQEIVLAFRQNALTLGELILLWGTPETRDYCKALVSWPIPRITTVVVVPRTQRVDYFAPVQSISFLRPPVPYWKQAVLLDITQGCMRPW